jgi:hypothetical protein
VERAIYRAYEEVAAGFSSTWETWERFELEESETRDSGDSVLGLGRVKMRGSASHVELDQEFAVHGLVRDGELISIPAFLSWHEALEALGLAGWTTSRIWIEWCWPTVARPADGRDWPRSALLASAR